MNTAEVREKLSREKPVPENGFRHYSILIPIIRDDGSGGEQEGEDLHLLYEVRGRDLDRQPGEICFPGGHVEDGETFAQCAIRETEEEVGIAADSIEILSELTVIYGVGRFAMHCFPAFVDAKAMDDLRLNDEVEEVFTVPLEELMRTEVQMYHSTLIQEGPEDFPYEKVTGEDSYKWSRLKAPVPVYDVGHHVIWGLTGRATKVLLEALDNASEDAR